MDCIHQNGNITSYSVRYGVQGSETLEVQNVSGGVATNADITGLANNVTYNFEVAAVNSAGIGVYSNPVTLKGDHKGKSLLVLPLFRNMQ